MLSVILPVYNGEDTIETCLASLAAQTLSPMEVVLVDDGSTDATLSVAQRFLEQNSHLQHQIISIAHVGSSKAREAGIRTAKGDIVGFIDADDTVSAQYYEKLLSKMGEATIVCGAFTQVSSAGQKRIWNEETGDLSPAEAKTQLFEQRGVYQYLWNKLFRKEVLLQAEFPDAMIAEDLMLVLQGIGRCSSIRVTNEDGYCYTRKKGTQSKSGYDERYCRMHQQLHRLLNSEKEAVKPALQRFVLWHDLSVLMAMGRNQNRDLQMEKEIVSFVQAHIQDFMSHSNYGSAVRLMAWVVARMPWAAYPIARVVRIFQG